MQASARVKVPLWHQLVAKVVQPNKASRLRHWVRPPHVHNVVDPLYKAWRVKGWHPF